MARLIGGQLLGGSALTVNDDASAYITTHGNSLTDTIGP